MIALPSLFHSNANLATSSLTHVGFEIKNRTEFCHSSFARRTNEVVCDAAMQNQTAEMALKPRYLSARVHSVKLTRSGSSEATIVASDEI